MGSKTARQAACPRPLGLPRHSISQPGKGKGPYSRSKSRLQLDNRSLLIIINLMKPSSTNVHAGGTAKKVSRQNAGCNYFSA